MLRSSFLAYAFSSSCDCLISRMICWIFRTAGLTTNNPSSTSTTTTKPNNVYSNDSIRWMRTATRSAVDCAASADARVNALSSAIMLLTSALDSAVRGVTDLFRSMKVSSDSADSIAF